MDGAKEPEEHNHVQNKHSLNNGEYTQVENALDANKSSSDDKSIEKSELRTVLESFLNKTMKIKMSDGRSLIGSFLCTDKDANLILGNCQEYIYPPTPEFEVFDSLVRS
ncbi:PREDICTED: N-alpha-acetyltransferase 38, NatC auxiliary subunit-like [Priapulus caudatus]|uniref:N-alpha-acetyltransferase 38, NatC auxiliary subunit-like n=1 Tax=Priapulus caudatus TaxID=37621 RepID=A0ABM1EYA7_PRICU|nr:PREDICTED: N-alpha-acetyltransferase 38, NatC auxiliary subunit-like [Priapulus caudatus]